MPPVCKDNESECTEDDVPYPDLKDLESVIYSWSPPDDLSSQCSGTGGTTQTQKISCELNYRCTCDYVPFPSKADNEVIFFTWTEGTDRTQECHDAKGSVQKSRLACVNNYRCVGVTEEPPKECDVEVSSYVSPRDGVFHEDIEVTGAGFGLHYSSANLDENNTIAYGWSLSSHATLKEDRLYLGSGTLWVVEPTVEDNFTVVRSGGSELLFNSEGKHIQTRDIYTKQIETLFEYDALGELSTITDKFGETTILNRDANGILTSITAPQGQTTHLRVDENSDLIEVQYEDTSSYTFAYEKHLMTLEREPNGNEFLHFFDAQGKVVKVIDAVQGEWNFETTMDSTSGTHTVQRASGDTVTYKNHFLQNNILKTEKTLPSGEIILYENALDDSRQSTTTCGQTTASVYKVVNGVLAKDPLHDRRILESTTQTTPGGLSKLTQFSTNYTFTNNALTPNCKRQQAVTKPQVQV